ncbi:hypothetical protein N4G70_34045 [Streptomyces sp. ASQP_92]|uniref:hypothetical protein n=1 Tax=Streptomyces sp. ASQP_92 TaxID=2979116 RepID=UPI0021C24B1B|nr:hypothetical protein [Streptomyces sp. ASQP_92]MCT9093846.1 hypothetical protein [Streptomyces sp. ASQP_92]
MDQLRPDHLQAYRVAAHVQLSEGADAVAVAADITGAAFADLPRERRAHLLADGAIGEKQAGLRTEAVTTLLKAAAQAPEELLCRPKTEQLVEDLRLLGAELAEGRSRALTDRCGLPP